MGLVGNVLKGVQDAVSTIAGLNGPKGNPVSDEINETLDKAFYETKAENWYKALPYGFKWVNSKQEIFYFLLPINPSNISIDAHFATNIVTSLYGVIEEHSEQRMFDISIEGTTGIAPRYTGAVKDNVSTVNSSSIKSGGRLAYSDTTDGGRAQLGADLAGGLFSRTIASVNTVLNKAQSAVGSLTGNKDLNRTGVFLDRSGYVAFHRLFKFFLKYKEDMVFSENPSTFLNGGKQPLRFMNYKDNQQYDCSIVSFKLRRNAEKPMLYDYSISLRAYNLRTINSTEQVGAPEDRAKDLGLDKTPSSTAFGQVKSASEGAKRLVGSVLGGFNPIGG